MGLSSSKGSSRQGCQESERPNSKTSEFCLNGSTSSEGGSVEQISATELCSSSHNSSAREIVHESPQQIKQAALGSTEIRERRVRQPPRILSRTRQVYVDPLIRVGHNEMGHENNPRILYRTLQVNTDSLTRFPSSEASHGQSSIEDIQARLRIYTGLSSSHIDMSHRRRQQVSDLTSPTRMIGSISVGTTTRYNGTSVLLSRTGRTGIASAGEIDGHSICDIAASSQNARRLASEPSYHEEFPTLRAELTRRESRRNGGRRFWDALTGAASASQRRLSTYQENHDSAGRILAPCISRSVVPNRRVGTIAPYVEERGRSVFRNRSLNLDERRRRFRSQVWALQRLSTSLESVPGHARPCVRRVHHEPVEQIYGAPQSSSEETDTRASISRIIMLAEALFQVLDEIHQQSLALSQSAGLSLGALRAPDAVVNSMPVRVFLKVDSVEEKEETALQCHICLLEYEGGDQLRVLPCHHEYHMTCIDKWLREVHRICPLCRGDVCELTAMAK